MPRPRRLSIGRSAISVQPSPDPQAVRTELERMPDPEAKASIENALRNGWLTSKAFRRGYGVCCALYGIFNFQRGHAIGYVFVIVGIAFMGPPERSFIVNAIRVLFHVQIWPGLSSLP